MFRILEQCVNPYIDAKNEKIYRCGTCQLCKRKKSLEWTARVVHEISTTEDKKATFITLTYDRKNLPKCNKDIFIKQAKDDKGGNLRPEDVTLFLKRLRKKIDKPIKYLYCGEYGGINKRPHYHMIIIGLNPEEVQLLNIQKIWGKGYVDIDKRLITDRAVQYTLGYVRKKINNINEKYEEIGRIKPYQRQSQGMGKTWALKNVKCWAKTGSIAVNEYQQGIPRYYKKKIWEMEGAKYKYTNEIYVPEIGLHKKNKNNYKVVKNNEGTYTKLIRKNQLRQQLSGLRKHKDVNNCDINYEFYYNLTISRYKDDYKRYRHEYKEYKKTTREYELLGNTRTKTIYRTAEEHIKRLRKHTRDMVRKLQTLRGMSYQTALKLHSVAKNKLMEMLTSPFGHRDKL